MKVNIQTRLFLTLLGATGAAVLCLFILLQWSVDRGFLRYVNTVEMERMENLAGELERAYAEEGSWEFIRRNPGGWLRSLAADREGDFSSGPRMRNEMPMGGPRHSDGSMLPPRFGRIILLDAEREPVFGTPRRQGQVEFRPLRQDGRVVGYLGLQRRQQLTDIHQLRFVEQQKLAMALATGAIFLISAGLALPLANRLVRPIRSMAAATHRLAAGRYETRVPVASSDELGQLARDFNDLAFTLEKNEAARRQWLADISHELRTPLSILRGEIEALQDGIRQPTPEAIGSLHGEVLHLGRLVEDLHQLSLSDLGALTYRKEEVDLTELLTGMLPSHGAEAERKGLVLQGELPPSPVLVFADRERLRQLFGNLLDNALKYTDSGGRVEVRLEQKGEEVAVQVLDSAPGVPESEIPRLFERFYRREGSRSRTTGGAGLGLAICRNIVEAHGGRLDARPSPLGGLWLEARLPLAKEES